MKKIFIGIVLSIMLCLFLDSSPISVKADMDGFYPVGYAVYQDNFGYHQTVLCMRDNIPSPTSLIVYYPDQVRDPNGNYCFLYFLYTNGSGDGQCISTFFNSTFVAGYIPTLENTVVNNIGGGQFRYIYKTYDDYLNAIPEEFWPEDPSIQEQIWDSFYDIYELIFGYRPLPGSLIDILRETSLGDHSDATEIVFPTSAPTPTPTPSPTPIPVQTIFIPDGNGNTTIIYQYPDPTTGVITQSPYNPNITNNIEVNCDCDGGSGGGSNPFGSSPQDPYTLLADLNWGTALGVDMSDNPLIEADNSQTTIKGVAEEYTPSVEVLSNSFNILPGKWIMLAGLLGGILILAGLLRTFLGG